MYVYIDESCSSGANNFDSDQPTLYSLATVSRSCFDALSVYQFDSLLKEFDVEELHGNDLGISKIDDMSHRLTSLIEKFKLEFVFARIDKMYLCLTKLFDVMFDPFDNLAVPWHAYNIKEFRMILLFKVSYVVDREILKLFWEGCLFEWRGDVAAKNFTSVCNKMLLRVDVLPDQRSREIISQALLWALNNPENIVFYFRDETLRSMGAANFLAFSALLPEISRKAKLQRKNVTKIIHDEQNEFDKAFKDYHKTIIKSGPISMPEHFSFGRLDFDAIKNSEFSMVPSSMSRGLQLTDIALFALKKDTEGKHLKNDILIFANRIKRRMTRFTFTYDDAAASTKLQIRQIMEAPLSEEQISRGHELLRDIEKRRLEAMRAYKAGS